LGFFLSDCCEETPLLDEVAWLFRLPDISLEFFPREFVNLAAEASP
jgi:hypothetical protein